MADITMCVNNDCPLAQTCYRQQAPSDSEWQSLCSFEFTTDSQGNVKCDNYLSYER